MEKFFINQIKNTFKIKIKKVELNSFKDYNPIPNTYSTDENGEIIKLSIAGRFIDNPDLTFLGELKFLRILWMSNCCIEKIYFMSKLKSLEVLYLDNNIINDISSLSELTKLKALGLWVNKITDISPLSGMVNLEILNLGGNAITDIDAISKLKKIKSLYLWNNYNIKSYNPIKQLEKLENLYLMGCGIRNIEFLSSIKTIIKLNLSNNFISDLSFLLNKENISELDLSYNELIDISSIGELKKIKTLLLNNNFISDISGIMNLINLEYLDLNHNIIVDVSPLNNLKGLKNLSIEYNKIETLYPLKNLLNLLSLNFVSSLSANNNPLQTPPMQTVSRGVLAILRYFDKIEKEGKAFIYESKVTFVGEGSAGKTSLQRRLINSKAILPSEDKRTRGIEVIDWEFKKTKGKLHIAHIWDFGGQDVYYPVHRFFITENSVFVLLASSRQNTHNFEYWIPTIFQFGGKSPIILAQTCHDGNKTPWNDLGIYQASENFNIINANENIYHELNLKDNRNIGLSGIKKSIINQVINLPQYKKNVPKSWLEVRNIIVSLKNKNCISYLELKDKIVTNNKMSFSQKEDVEDCIKFFHDIGLILWYNKNLNLKNWVVLNPSWSVDAVYKIIDDEKILNQKGIILNDDFNRVWKDKKYDDKHSILKNMLEVFKIAFPKKHNTCDFIIPARLISIPKESIWEYTNCDLHIEYKYEFMPKGMVNQISAELSRYIVSDEQVWNNGVNLIYEKSEAQIFEDFYNRKISIKSKGIDARGFIMTIMNAVKNITDEYKGVLPKIIIPCPCKSCKNQSDPEKFNYENLLSKLEKNINAKVMCNNSDEVFEINSLLYLNGLTNPIENKIGNQMNNEIKTVKIFLASSNELKDEREKFRNFISTENDRLHKKGIYFQIVQWEYFLDEISNSRLQDEYDIKLKECDIALCLFFTKVGKFTEEEFETAYTKFKSDGKPKIWTYFKDADIKTGNITDEINTLLNFKKKIRELGHFGTSYSSTSDLHLQFKRQLDFYLDTLKL